MRPKQIVAIGGGGFSVGCRPTPLDDFLLQLAGVEKPRICFVGTASGDSPTYIDRFYGAFSQRPCVTTHLPLFTRDSRNLGEVLLGQEIIFVGGGNTVNMLAVWRAHGVDALMREAYRQGVILAGISAGALCWFEGGTTDSYGGLAPLDDGLGILPGTVCPHYSLDPGRPELYRQVIRDGLKPGLAIDDGAAAHYVDGKLKEVVGEVAGCSAYSVTSNGESRIPARLLGSEGASLQALDIRRISRDSLSLVDGALDLFAEAFEDPESYRHHRPGLAYLERLLARDTFTFLVALDGDKTVGALAAYHLEKFEQERSEVYIYDLAVAESHRRQGIATALIEHLKGIARARGAWVIYVQADHGDDPAVNLYTKLGKREDVMHFDIPLE